jgi:alpha-1,2-mannosyltransferase
MTRWWLAAVAVVTAFFVVRGLSFPKDLIDLDVYRAGGASWLHGVPLYTEEFPFWLPFTYPPFAAVLFGALAILPLVAAATLLTAASLVGLSLASFAAVPHRVVALLAVGGGILLEPVRTTLKFGQVNLVLMGLVAADCLLGRTRYPRGLLVGLAAAVKLTPAVFILFFLARRQPGAAVTATVTFAAATGAGMLFAPADSLRYWHTTLLDPSRIGGVEFATNQSLRAALARLGLPEVCWVVLVLVVLALAWRGARRVAEPAVALLVVAAAGLLVSPVSWSHHWVWIVPAVFVFAVRLYRNRHGMVALAAVVVVFLAGHRFLPHAHQRELEWTWWQHVLGNSYILTAITFLLWCATRESRVRPPRVPRSDTPSRGFVHTGAGRDVHERGTRGA